MKIEMLELGALGTDCYIVSSESKNAVVIDPADEADVILSSIRENGLNLKYILLTHGHFDHTGAVAELIKETGAKVYIHSSDECMLNDEIKNVSYLLPGYKYHSFVADVLVEDGDEIKMDEITFRVMHTPGHTAGSVMYIAEDCIFSGDTIFACGVGRTDFYSGDLKAQRKSLSAIAALDGEYRIFPGHGPDTTLAYEIEENPYLPHKGYEDLFGAF